ncbi:hypothetical protein SPI_06009 [Niveomyces insectorum RCEF 264]|uniref:Duf1479 domain containing protein n=1 Tax=Niveomyces insectorum RCEF 264 TaxID=1081102 RepID=A0A167SPJ2_9HYPO|nr:hypothetical protein SPI_06009 [Niveomyces insectorum RCEF 264]
MASLSAGVLAATRPPGGSSSSSSSPSSSTAVVDRLTTVPATSPRSPRLQSQLHPPSDLHRPSALPSPAVTPTSSTRKPFTHTLRNSEHLRDNLFPSLSSFSSSSSSSTSSSQPSPSSRRSASGRLLESDGSSGGGNGTRRAALLAHSSAALLPSVETADSVHTKASDDNHNGRRVIKLRYRAQSAATASISGPPPAGPAGAEGAERAEGPATAAVAAAATTPRGRELAMDPPVLSFYGAQPVPLPSRFAHIKRRLAAGHHDELRASWARLLAALDADMRAIRAQGNALIPSIDFAHMDDPAAVAAFGSALKRFGVGVIRGVVPPADASAWVRETRAYLELNSAQHNIKPPAPQDPTCFDFFWTPAQVRARAHPHVLRAMTFAMRFWAGAGQASADDPRMAVRYPISYADRIRIHVGTEQKSTAAAAATTANSTTTTTTTTAASPTPIIAQVDGGSLERWEPDGYGRDGTYDAVFRGRWEDYDPWDPAGRVQATPDLYNGAGACSIFRMFQGLLALTDVTPGMVRLLPSPQLTTAYFLLRPFFRPKTPPPPPSSSSAEGQDSAAWDAFLAADNWELETEPSTIIHGAVPGHAQRVTELWHPHLQLRQSLVTPPRLQAGDYVLWHCDTPYTITSGGDDAGVVGEPALATPSGRSENAGANTATATATTTTKVDAALPSALGTAPLLVYMPACPLTQTNALYLARQRKAFMRGHPGPDFDLTGSGLGSEADHTARLGEDDIAAVGGPEGLRAMGLAPWEVDSKEAKKVKVEDNDDEDGKDTSGKMEVDGEPQPTALSSSAPGLSQAELELVRLANIILFPDKYEFYMPTRHNSPDSK